MPKKAKVKKRIKIKDGLGICRSCANFNSSEFPNTVCVGQVDYFRAQCQSSARQCFVTRSSLLECALFKFPPTPKRTPLILRLWNSFKNNNWNELKG